VSNELEQLWFTWCEIGLEGRSRFQVRAASPGFSDLRSRLTLNALQICRYEAPPRDQAPAPVSYGWIDLGGTRFAFRRCDAGQDGYGRPGRFFAHIVAGRPSDLAALWVAERYGSSFWRADDDGLGRSVALSQVSIADVQPGPMDDVSEDLVATFCAALIEAQQVGRRLAVVTSDADVFASLLARSASGLVPGALDRMAVSTYEATSTSSSFDVVGVMARVAAPAESRILELDSAVVADRNAPGWRLLSTFAEDDPDARGVVAAAATDSDGSVHLDRAVRVNEALVALRSGEEIGIDSLLPALEVPAGVSKVLSDAAGAETIARGLVGGRDDAWRAIESAARSLHGPELGILGIAVAHQLWEALTLGAPSGTAHAVVGRSRRLSRHLAVDLAVTFFTDARSSPSVLAALALPDRTELAHLVEMDPTASAAGMDDPVVAAVLGSTPLEALALAHSDLPVEITAWPLAACLAQPSPDPRLVSAAVANPELAVQVVREAARTGRINEVSPLLFRGAPDLVADRITQWACDGGVLQATDRDVVVCGYAGRSSTPDRLRLLANYVMARLEDRSGSPIGPQVATFMCLLLRVEIAARRSSVAELLPDTVRQALVDLSGLGRLPSAWANLVTVTGAVQAVFGIRSSGDRLQAIEVALDDLRAVGSIEDLEAAAEYVCDRLADACRTETDVEYLRRWLARFLDSSVQAHVRRMLWASLRRGTYVGDSTAGCATLLWIAAQIGTKQIKVTWLRESHLQELSESVARDQPGYRLAEYGRMMKDYPKASTTWWKSIVEAGTGRQPSTRRRL
jgi:hypothetical protein